MTEQVIFFEKFCPMCNKDVMSDSESGETFFCPICGTKLLFSKDFLNDYENKKIGFAAAFDNTSADQVITRLKQNKDLCLKERNENWKFCFGFIQMHLIWFETLKKKVE